MTQCTEEVNSHATFLLASLNLQRTRAQFCDCVVRQTQSPAHLYPAHSPVLASLLSTTGALVELQDPCFSDSVLVLVLDFIYTGALKPPIGHQQYCSLLAAACHLQMDQLEEALRACGTESQLYTKTISTHGELVRTYSKTHSQPFSPSTDTYKKLVETDTCSGVGLNSLEKPDDRYSTSVNTCGETQRHSATLDSRIKLTERNTGSSSSINTSLCYSSKTKSRSTLSTVNTCCSLAVSTESSKNTSGCIRLHSLVQQDWQRTPRRQQSQPEKGQESGEEALVRHVEERRGSSSPHVAEMQEEMRSRAETQICSLQIDAGFGPGAGAKAGHQAGALVGGEPAKVEGAGMTTSLPACVSPSAPDGMTASMSSPLPVNMPSAVSVCTPSSVPAHLSALVHQPYQCTLCDRSFSQRGSLNRHMRSHLGVRPYSCPRCPMTFSRQYRVTEHMRVHQLPNIFCCSTLHSSHLLFPARHSVGVVVITMRA
uniref:C2H2-type domain-containing protein n=1 Tax=Myripristis murdjan TaxID=586833 RepID=A0A667ZTM4_9TELE